MKRVKSLLLGAALSLCLTAPVWAADTIKIGNTMPYSGPLSVYGTVGRAIASYFEMINDNGGINGRMVEFITLDDAYSPPKTVEQIRKLVEQEEVLLLFSTTGTPTNSAVHKYINAKKIPHLFLYTGASKWGQPKDYPWTMGYWPAYATEAKVYAQYILDNIPDARIGILSQNDDYGKDYVEGFKDGLGAAADKLIVAEMTFEATDPTIDSQIVTLKTSGANVFFDVTSAKHAAQAIRRAYDIGWHPTHFLNNVSTSVEVVLKTAGLEKAVGIISAAYLKDPTDPQWRGAPDYEAWIQWMDRYYPEGNKQDYLNSYAYGVAFVMTEVLKACGDDLSRENIMRQAASMTDLEVPMVLPGIRINTSPDDFYPVQQLKLMRFDGEKWALFGEVIAVE